MNKHITKNIKFMTEAITSLTVKNKWLDSKWFYDKAGSILFEEITKLPEYYPTRTEVTILQDNITQIKKAIPKGAALVELGSGSSIETRILLNELDNLRAYLPLDISEDFLKETANELSQTYTNLTVKPIVADFMKPIKFPAEHADSPKVAFFPGSTIGNLETDAARQLLSTVHNWGNVSAFIIGLDLVKNPDVLINAYDDAAGVTAEFNLNILRRMNNEIGANFNLDAFKHQAVWNADKSRIEMHLISQTHQTVIIGNTEINFVQNERIHTENSHKYTQTSFGNIAKQAGWNINSFLTDKNNLFAIAVLIP